MSPGILGVQQTVPTPDTRRLERRRATSPEQRNLQTEQC